MSLGSSYLVASNDLNDGPGMHRPGTENEIENDALRPVPQHFPTPVEQESGIAVIRGGGGVLSGSTGASAPNFIVSHGGVVYPVPAGATGPTMENNGKGIQFQGGSDGNGLSPNTTGFRFMDPVTSGPYQYPYGYGSYNNSSGQAVNPLTGKTIPRTDPIWHIPGK